MRTVWTFHTAGQLVFGPNAVDQLSDIIPQLGARRVLIVTDKSLVDAGLSERVAAPIRRAKVDVEIFDGGRPDPPTTAVELAAAMASEASIELLIGLGGGSNMDLAKAAATLMVHGGRCQDYAGDQLVPGPIHPLVLIPTTAGTGSEVTASAVLNDTEKGTKFGILSNYLRPKTAVVDPLLTLSCPPPVTADSGIDALTHAIEAYTAVDNETFPLPPTERTVYQGRHVLGDTLAERAIRLVGKYLRRAVADGTDREAREGMSLGATLAGMAFSNVGVAIVHALEYVLAPIAHIPHGRGCGLLLPYVMEFNRSARPDQMARVAGLLGEDTTGLSLEQASDRAVSAVKRLKAAIGIPAGMSELGVQREHLPAMAEKAFGLKRLLRVNPRTANQQDLLSILESAL
jgi:alcohol dehydrogenase class IV